MKTNANKKMTCYCYQANISQTVPGNGFLKLMTELAVTVGQIRIAYALSACA